MKKLVAFLTSLLSFRFFPLVMGKTLYFGDNYSLLVPGKIFTSQWLRRGILPFWNPYLFIGQSWIGNLNESILYPSTLLFVTFDPAIALSLNVFIHTAISAVGAYFLSRAFIKQEWARYSVVVIWIFSAQWTATYDNLSVIQSACYIPWILLASIHLQHSLKSKLLLASFVVLQIAGGYPQYVIYSVGFGFPLHLWIHRKANIGRFLQAGLIAVLLSAVWWMPFLTLLHSSTRSIQTPAQLASGALHPLELLRAIVPTIFDDSRVGMKWGPFWNTSMNPGLYVGLFGVLSVGTILRRHRLKFDWVCMAFIAGSIFLAMLGSTGFSPLHYIPLLASSRGAGLILLPATLIAAIWIGSAFERLSLERLRASSRPLWFGLILVLTFASFLVMLSQFGVLWHVLAQLSHGRLGAGWHTFERDSIIFKTIVIHSMVSFAAAYFLYLALRAKKHFLFVLVLLVDLSFATAGRTLFAANAIYPTWKQLTMSQQIPVLDAQGNDRVLIANGNSPYTDFPTYWDATTVRQPFSDSFVDQRELYSLDRLREMRNGLTPDWNMVYGIRSLNGYAAFVPTDVDAVFNTSDPSINSMPPISPTDSRLSEYGVRTYWQDTWYPHKNHVVGLDAPVHFGNYELYTLSGNSGRFHLTDESSFQILKLEETPNTQVLNYQSSKASDLVIADRFDSDWKATIDGKEVPISEFHGQRKIPIESGIHTLTLQYVPVALYRGFVITVLTLLVCLGALVRSNYFKKTD